MKKKLKLNDLKIQSFVTALNDEHTSKMKGGQRDASYNTCPEECDSPDITDGCFTNSCVPGIMC